MEATYLCFETVAEELWEGSKAFLNFRHNREF